MIVQNDDTATIIPWNGLSINTPMLTERRDARSIGYHSFVFWRMAVIFLRGNRFFLLFYVHVDLTEHHLDIFTIRPNLKKKPCSSLNPWD